MSLGEDVVVKALWSSVRTYAYIFDVASMASIDGVVVSPRHLADVRSTPSVSVA